jgi:hypothetical protein
MNNILACASEKLEFWKFLSNTVSLTAPKFLIQFFDEVGGSISNHDCF